jgi:hypothetical protein
LGGCRSARVAGPLVQALSTQSRRQWPGATGGACY